MDRVLDNFSCDLDPKVKECVFVVNALVLNRCTQQL